MQGVSTWCKPSAVWTCRLYPYVDVIIGCIHPHQQQCGRAGRIPLPFPAIWTCRLHPSILPAKRRAVQGVSILQCGCAGCIPPHHLQCVRAGCTLSTVSSATCTSLVPECYVTGLRCHIPKCQRWWHRHRCRCPPLPTARGGQCQTNPLPVVPN